MSDFPAPADLVPQAGHMCLLDTVSACSAERVTCTSASHRRADHPLRRGGILAAVHLLEYAAQATAVHGALRARGRGDRAPAKYLVAAREVELHVSRFEDVREDLSIDAERLMAMGESAIYAFRVTAAGRLLAEGRLSIATPAEAST